MLPELSRVIIASVAHPSHEILVDLSKLSQVRE